MSRPEVIARRIDRYKRNGTAGLRATEGEIEAQKRKFPEPIMMMRRGLGATRVVKLASDGLYVGTFPSRLTRYPWEEVVCAHVLSPQELIPKSIQVELADGSAIDVGPRSGRGEDDVAELLAPRWFPEGAADERTILDPPVESKRELVWKPARKKKPKKKPKKKRERETA